jgi:hypothetical protein
LQTLVSVCPAESAQVTPGGSSRYGGMQLFCKAIDRPAAEFINANVNLGWLLTAQFLTAFTGSYLPLRYYLRKRE